MSIYNIRSQKIYSRALVTSAVIGWRSVWQTGGADAPLSRIDIGEEAGHSDRLVLCHFKAIGDGARAGAWRRSGTGRGGCSGFIPRPEARWSRLATGGRSITTGLGPAFRRSAAQHGDMRFPCRAPRHATLRVRVPLAGIARSASGWRVLVVTVVYGYVRGHGDVYQWETSLITPIFRKLVLLCWRTRRNFIE